MKLAPFAAVIDSNGQYLRLGNRVSHHPKRGKNGGHRITRGWDRLLSVGPSKAERVFDPAVEARHAEVNRFLAKDLVLQLLLTHVLH